MRKAILFLFTGCFLMICVPRAYAQQGLKLGGFFLPQFTTLYNSDDMNLDTDEFLLEPLGGMAVGLNFGYNPSRYFGLRMNLIYSQQGSRYSARGGFDERITYTTRLGYVKIPLMIGLNSNDENHKIMFSIYGGFQFGFLARAWRYDDNTAYVPPLPPTITNFPDTYAQYRSVNNSVVGDIGLDIKMTRNVVVNLHLRGDYSILDAEDKDVTYRLTENGFTKDVPYWETGRASTRNMGIGLMIGATYTFISQ
jgi:hypothetical protein